MKTYAGFYFYWAWTAVGQHASHGVVMRSWNVSQCVCMCKPETRVRWRGFCLFMASSWRSIGIWNGCSLFLVLHGAFS